MNRISLLLVALVAVIATACSSEQTSPSAEASETPTQAPTASPTQEPSASPSESAQSSGDASGDGSALADLLPDELDGVERTDVPGLEAMIGPLLAQQGIDASEADFAFASYGQGPDAVQVQAFRIPGMSQVQLEQLAQLMSGSQSGGEVSAETATVGGKSVLRISGAQVPGAAFMYLLDGAMFTVVSESEELAEQLLAELP